MCGCKQYAPSQKKVAKTSRSLSNISCQRKVRDTMTLHRVEWGVANTVKVLKVLISAHTTTSTESALFKQPSENINLYTATVCNFHKSRYITLSNSLHEFIVKIKDSEHAISRKLTKKRTRKEQELANSNVECQGVTRKEYKYWLKFMWHICDRLMTTLL